MDALLFGGVHASFYSLSLLRHDLTLSVSEPDNATAQTGAGTEKSTNTSPYPDEVIDRLARAFYPAILACWNSEEGQWSLVGAMPLHLAVQDRSAA